jgi:hypothetical protein
VSVIAVDQCALSAERDDAMMMERSLGLERGVGRPFSVLKNDLPPQIRAEIEKTQWELYGTDLAPSAHGEMPPRVAESIITPKAGSSRKSSTLLPQWPRTGSRRRSSLEFFLSSQTPASPPLYLPPVSALDEGIASGKSEGELVEETDRLWASTLAILERGRAHDKHDGDEGRSVEAAVTLISEGLRAPPLPTPTSFLSTLAHLYISMFENLRVPTLHGHRRARSASCP